LGRASQAFSVPGNVSTGSSETYLGWGGLQHVRGAVCHGAGGEVSGDPGTEVFPGEQSKETEVTESHPEGGPDAA